MWFRYPINLRWLIDELEEAALTRDSDTLLEFNGRPGDPQVGITFTELSSKWPPVAGSVPNNNR